MIRYYDASALVKRYVLEPGAADVGALMAADGSPITGAASGAEVPAALAKATRLGSVSLEDARAALQAFLHEWERYERIPLDGRLGREAGELAWRHGLRGFDAVHLAAAIRAGQLHGESVTLVTYDHRLAEAAKAAGLEVYPGSPWAGRGGEGAR
ncbi:MAG: type II toxin-antitoxin system VapC family toxin [Anaerolineae bacterium]|nr:type II toxin-antitoxin system VapC family toxin [Anaerolineae bacterium]